MNPPDPALVARFKDALGTLMPGSDDARLGLAVSGGPDSLALLLLAWAACPGRVEAATVDHGLRPEAGAEAEMVQGVCDRLGVRHVTLRRSAPLAQGRGVQAAARELRYTAMASWCGERRLAALLTGHHADDQAETLLMRLRRGAGIDGLAGVRPVRPIAAPEASLPDRRVVVLRPLLGFTRAELAAVAGRAGLDPVDDPSNRDAGYDRTHARRLLAETGWIDPRRIAASAANLAEAAHALDWAARQEFARRVRDDGAQGLTFDPEGLPGEILRRVVEFILADIARPAPGPACHTPAAPLRGPELSRFIARLTAGRTATLGRVLARPGLRWRFTVAPPRRT
ncbi:tRNA lysidine(34) synthetase TilS [Sphingomonas solaris]|uniref:tRNA(Ile)-lysidine synthase n=1 Tax=Alterirhizorhabdus solaris TaxID=2529389 RepID=A0A558R2T3_9SPHN|nr:tRNA lysidine(34) synthetase TilS [Sphingomonas solaris]TVV73677.1 tRNA lysidine(34) synthetase TilS [Sphingomonas solaris]